MKSKVSVFLFLCVFAFNGASVVSATTVTDIMGGYPGIPYGDFDAWSLPVLDALAAANFDTGVGVIFNDTMTFSQATSPGQIKDDVVLYTFPAAAVDNTDVFGGDNLGDDAFETTKQIIGSYSTNIAPADADQTGTWDTNNAGGYTWDVSVAALKDFLDNGVGGYDAPIFYFNNNQVGSDLAANSLFFWGQVSLTGSSTNPAAYFYFNNPYASTAGFIGDMSTTVPQADAWSPPADLTGIDDDPYYAFLPGFVYVDLNSGYLTLDPSTDPGPNPTPDWQYVKLNLGANEAAYAAYSHDLYLALINGGYDAMHVDFRMGTPIGALAPNIGELNNGYEQLIIRKSSVDIPTVPEPATMSLLGFGLLALAAFGRKKKIVK